MEKDSFTQLFMQIQLAQQHPFYSIYTAGQYLVFIACLVFIVRTGDQKQTTLITT